MSKMDWRNEAIGTVLKNEIDVPDYQRDYSWDEQEVLDFINDLRLFVNGKDEEYLFGQIILHREGKVLHIVDGQQRLCTSVIFIKAMRDVVDELGRELNIDALNYLKYNLCEDIGSMSESGVLLSRFSLGGQNKIFFNDYIICGNHNVKVVGKSNKRLVSAYSQLCNCILDLIKDYEINEKIKILNAYRKDFLEKFRVSYVETEDLGQAYIVFETLNSRGKQLEVKDLLKNYFFRNTKDLDHVKEKWSSMSERISITKYADVSKFIRYYWNATHPFVRSRGLFRDVSRELNGEVDGFLNKMFQATEIYLDMVSPSENNSFTRKSVKYLEEIRAVKATSFYPVVLSAYLKNISPANIERLLSAIECLIVRNQVIMGHVANRNEIDFANVAYSLFSDKLAIEDVILKLRSLTVSDAELDAKFTEYSPKEEEAKFVLKALYDASHSETIVSSDGKKVHLEHVMPVTMGEWDIESNTHSIYCRRFGNMTLLNHSLNESIQNSLFDVKKEQYLLSDIPDTRKIAEYEKWTEVEIDERQKDLLNEVKQRWPVHI